MPQTIYGSQVGTETLPAGRTLTVSILAGSGCVLQRLFSGQALETVNVSTARSFGPYDSDMVFRASTFAGSTVALGLGTAQADQAQRPSVPGDGKGTVAALSAVSYSAAKNLALTVDTDGLVLLPESADPYSECNVLLTQGAGGYVARFAGNVAWSGGVEPIPPLNPGDFAHYRCVSVDAGQTWAGAQLAPPSQPRAFDRFARANSASSLGSAEVGGAWTAHSGTWGVIDGAAYCVARSGDTVATVDTGSGNHSISCRVTPGISQSTPSIAFRFVDTANFWALNLSNPNASPQIAALWKQVAGSWTLAGSVNTFGNIITVGQSTLWAVVCSGTSIKLYANGALILSVTDSALQTATRAGLRVNDANISGCRWNDFVVV